MDIQTFCIGLFVGGALGAVYTLMILSQRWRPERLSVSCLHSQAVF